MSARPTVLLSDVFDEPPEPALRFRLHYDGPLWPTGNDPSAGQRNNLAQHKHDIRRKFHVQLRELWRTNRFLREYRQHPKGDIGMRPVAASGGIFDYEEEEKVPMWELVAKNYTKFGYNFVPLVRDEISLLCSLDILFMRRDMPGSVLHAGDIDNRIKTLIDTLRAPNSPNELTGADTVPGSDDTPFYCLLWDDKQVSRFAVETDTLLDPPVPGDDEDQRKVRLIVTVSLLPYDVMPFNLSFAGA